ncbi:3-(cis-5,6-dihydroxycyclohexa-1,3-dien-1-yl)propanoate dehydrogenase [Amycolatopsis sp. GM8]|uniref:3-(cis-5,6-dihydroxycyclohexa-1, 3-dien-1-yl)propanoate dehydrogenase n=1 Tax=Amycolatopsis sp. GM8 TaxID=2896530 RepID=UPI001F000AFA|nr:3-(cis-5,6-dihydroxycyclohexa-1,3-dien-1-yl)propanoate dehydrogenase [Amycolatopsis sp. GM8]
MGSLDGRAVLITGGGSGLGRALAERFLEEGARVAILDRSPEKLAQVTKDLGPDVPCVAGDVTSARDNAKAVESAIAAFGKLDVFIGNAGLWDFGKPLTDIDPDELGPAFDELFAVNVKAYLLGARASVDALRSTRGSMIFTLSNASFFPMGGGPLYTASKHAGVGVVRQLAFELAPEIRVNGVAPGGMATDLRGPGALGLERNSIGDMPIGEYQKRFSALEIEIEPADYVGAYLLLASPTASRTVTGTVFDLSSVGTPQRPAPSA